jgi:hypothetical protein
MTIPETEQRMIQALERGETVAVNMRKSGHPQVIEWAKAHGLFVRIDRKTLWGNPFVMGKDGSRAEVMLKYAFAAPMNDTLMKDLPTLRGKALGCWCAPLPCHGDVLIQLLKASA